MGLSSLALVFAAALTVRGTTACPTPAEVTDALAALSPPAPASRMEEIGEVVVDGDGIRVRLVDQSGAVLAEKRLPAGSCRKLAETAAVVLAAWASELRPEIALKVELPPPSPRASSASIVSAAAPAGPSSAWGIGAGAHVLASHDGNGVAPALGIEARVHASRRWGGRLALRTIGTHRLDVGSGQAAWHRTSVALGLFRRVVSPRLFGEGSFDLVSGVLTVEGEGFTIGDRTRSLDAGAELGARVGLRLGAFEPYLGAALAGWLRPQIVEVSGVPGRERLPSTELRVGLGLTVLWER